MTPATMTTRQAATPHAQTRPNPAKPATSTRRAASVPMLRTPAQREDDAMLLVSEFTEIVRAEIGMHEQFANQIATAIVRGLRRTHGARRIYIPSVDRAERDAAIRAKFNGTNAADVMREFNISRSRLYEIAGAERAQA
jgi:Mor family transcriptional regulator